MGAGRGEQGTPGADGRADVFFNALRKWAVARTMTADDRFCEVVAITCRNVRMVEVDHPCFCLVVKQRNMFIDVEYGNDVASEKYL